MTDPSRGDAGEYDELAEAVAREHADRLVAHRRLRAWLMSATASAALIVLALTVVSLPDGQRHQSRSPEPGLSAPPLDLPLLHIDGRDQVSQLLSGVQVLSGIVLPTGWSSTMVTATNVESRTDPFHWSTLWIAKDQAADGPRVIAAALTGQGWQRCAGGGVRSECWQLGMYQLILTWGPGEGCPSQGPCSRAGVVLYITSPPTSPVALYRNRQPRSPPSGQVRRCGSPHRTEAQPHRAETPACHATLLSNRRAGTAETTPDRVSRRHGSTCVGVPVLLVVDLE